MTKAERDELKALRDEIAALRSEVALLRAQQPVIVQPWPQPNPNIAPFPWWPTVICGNGTADLPITYPSSLPVNLTGITPKYAETIGGIIQ
ncbi:MAG: hypothetical protein KGL39_31600 [Patescibacteria group bacterium]|nr:hypothetical protein [Patescibacteria group bacterium]